MQKYNFLEKFFGKFDVSIKVFFNFAHCYVLRLVKNMMKIVQIININNLKLVCYDQEILFADIGN
jgi:hypothetical protein